MVPSTNRREFLKSTAALGALTGVAGCAMPFGSGGSNWQLAIGMPTPQSGPLAPAGKAGLRGAEVAIEEVNADRDDPIKLVKKDGQASPEEARSVVQSMIGDNVPVFTGTFSSDVSNALSELVEKEDVPFMTGISVAPTITDESDEYTFRLTGDTVQKLTGMAQHFAELGVENVAIIGGDYSMPRSAVEFMKNQGSEYGFSVTHTSLVPLSTNNFAPVFRKINWGEVDALFLPFPGGNGPTLLQQANERGVFDKVDFVTGHDSYGSQLYKKALGDTLRGVGNWGVELSSDRAVAASKTMADKFGVPMDALSLPNYDCVHMIAEAMDRAGTDPKAIRDELANMTYDAASGWGVKFNDAGDNARYRMIVSEWQQTDADTPNVYGPDLWNGGVYTSDVIAP